MNRARNSFRFFFLHTGLAFVLLALLGGCNKAEKPEKSPVDPAKLRDLIKRADKITVFDGKTKDSNVLFTSTSGKDISEFKDALDVEVPESWFFCNCHGDLAVRLYRGDTELLLITNHHGVSVRNPAWNSDAMLKDPHKWARWFQARNVTGPLAQVEEMDARNAQRKVLTERFRAATPHSIQPLIEQIESGKMGRNVKPLRDALEGEFPDTRRRILELLSWYGAGDGPWSGSTHYEDPIEALLLEFPADELVAAVEAANLTAAQLEGAARIMRNGLISRQLGAQQKTLPSIVKTKLLNHSLESPDVEKHKAARAAFGK